jgi:hypothetical protein
MKLMEKMARRLRKALKTARGIHVACGYIDGSYWHRGRTFDEEMFTTDELYKKGLLEVVWAILGVERIEYTHYCRLSCIPRGR